ncbi:MAG: sigma 54-interacting transcriptional regulator, partial [Nitrospinota bacterium]|nr:sigma 54-interacting transcriptional regulator [Nitrospinota bacterium]
SKKLQNFGKDNLSDIMHFTATGFKDVFNCKTVRIYLEDLYEGMLICQYVTGQNQTDENRITQFISPKTSIISQAFYENNPVISWDLKEDFPKSPFEKLLGINASAAFPITFQLNPIGIVSLDWEEKGGSISPVHVEKIQSFLSEHGSIIDRAKRFHQKINFSKHLDLARKKEAAWTMLRSAVKLIDKLSLASVLVPVSQKTEPSSQKTPTALVEILAAYSKNEGDAFIYNAKDKMSVLDDQNLINRIIKYDPTKGLIACEPTQRSVYIENVLDEKFMRKPLAKKIDLVSLYQIPKFNKRSGSFICAVNYYTNSLHRFNTVEKRLLEEHASMVEKLVLEEGHARVEIQVLSEIEELLSERDDSLQTFLNKILDKTSELLGADSGTISIMKNIDGKPWLIVENDRGGVVGAKSRGWKKNHIPPLAVGGEDITEEGRSLTGYCAHTARPFLIKDVTDPLQTLGYYKRLSFSIQSELAVPIISGNSVLGVINQDSFQKQYFTKEHQDILQIIAQLISQKVSNLIQIEDLKQEIDYLARDIAYRDPKVSSYYFGNIIGKSENINTLVNQIDTVAGSICNRMLRWESKDQRESLTGLPSLLLTGKTGTGKEFFFNNIYSRLTEIFQEEKGLKFELPLKKTNIAAYSGELTYSELFGHKKGAFTGAESNRRGILEEANGGVVFLDEIGDADPKTQVQLLRFLDTGVFMRLGENAPRYSRIFLVAATNKNLVEEIEKGLFREDLYHRLNELSFHIPSLNKRKEDIEDLAIHFLGRLFHTYKNKSLDEPKPYLEKGAIDYLKSHHFRGNVRELKNILLRALLFCKGSTLTKADIIEACRVKERPSASEHDFSNNGLTEKILSKLETGESNFWLEVHRPFKNKDMTRDTVITLIHTAKSRYRTNLPGLALKLRACENHSNPEEKQKFISFKNFLYKTIKISDN